MAIYSFRRESDGKMIDRKFPIGECPDENICDDGVVAQHLITAPNVQWKGGFMPPGQSMKRNADMKRRQSDSGRRMRDNWESVSSK